MQRRKVAIIGSGPAGYSAAIYAARAGLAPLIITGMDFGGQITKTQHLENYPGFSGKIDGIYLTEEMRKQAEAFGAELLADTVVGGDFSKSPFTLECENGGQVSADAVIAATGTVPVRLGLPNEEKLTGRGVSYCATCDGFLYKGKDVFVVGGGNAAVYEALHLSTVCRHVTIVHRRDAFRAEELNQKRLFAAPNISAAWNSVVDGIVESDGKVAGVKVKSVKTGEISEYPASALFISIGHTPNTGLFKGQVELDAKGYIATMPDSMRTGRDGFFAAGDVRNPRFRQVVIAAASGAQAAMEAAEYLAVPKAG
ncbi:MAG: thioredoxin-disulfide reductase [Rickettsiales bacterium]|jgi:thioredoxin reductase (NADPH)|nr:thioredoxin-disulfide reductase [Rickettsiales bacterium]